MKIRESINGDRNYRLCRSSEEATCLPFPLLTRPRHGWLQDTEAGWGWDRLEAGTRGRNTYCGPKLGRYLILLIPFLVLTITQRYYFPREKKKKKQPTNQPNRTHSLKAKSCSDTTHIHLSPVLSYPNELWTARWYLYFTQVDIRAHKG